MQFVIKNTFSSFLMMDGGDLLVRAHLKDSIEYEAIIKQELMMPMLKALNGKSKHSDFLLYFPSYLCNI